jgi:hypothetical protein
MGTGDHSYKGVPLAAIATLLPHPLTCGAPDHWQICKAQEYWQKLMDDALQIYGPRWGQWISQWSWTHSHKETTLYHDWKRKVDNARANAINRGDINTMEHYLQIWEDVEEAIWAEEIWLQDDASDAKWLDELLSQTTASYELCCWDYVTWFANYKRRKATEQYRLDREHRLCHAKARANSTQKLAAALTIFLWNRRV